jgi:hypothetical protein
MGGAPGRNGITIQFYDETGSFTTRHALTQPFCHMTGQPQGAKGVGSDDWLKEVYLAPNQEGMYKLLRAHQPTGTVPPLTSAASQNVFVSYVDSDADGTVKSGNWKTAIGIGSDITIKLGDGKVEKVRLIDTLLLSNGDANANKNHGLYNIFHDAVIAVTD